MVMIRHRKKKRKSEKIIETNGKRQIMNGQVV